MLLLFSACVCNAQSMTDTTAMSMVVMTDSIVQDNTQTMEMSPQLQKVLRSTTYKRRARNENNEHHAVSLTAHIGLGDKVPYSTNKQITNVCLGYGYTF